jgi:arylsulfatase A-like enzyme
MIANGPRIVRPLGLSKELVDHSDVLPTLADFAGAKVPDDRPIDGRSFAPLLRGEAYAPREWIFSYIADRRILRTKRWLLEDNSPHHWGRLYDCGGSRNGEGYQDVTDSTDAEVLAVKKTFQDILADKPAPLLPEDGPVNKPPRSAAKKQRSKKPR